MSAALYVGLMSGTSLDGVDAALADLSGAQPLLLGSVHRPFEPELRAALLELNAAGGDEIDRAARLSNELARRYADAVAALLAKYGKSASDIRALGCHGQTVRHRPELGYTTQIGNAALLAELTGICVVADFRSRDIAAGGLDVDRRVLRNLDRQAPATGLCTQDEADAGKATRLADR